MKCLAHRLLVAASIGFCPSASIGAAESGDRSTEVVIVSTQHFITDMPEGYTPAHLRALFNRINLDVLVVEACTNVADPWATAPYELAKVTRP